MTLGEKIRQARLEAGLSQRQLCGEELTRNMLSLIENGAAKPSMKTLALLSQRLGKPLSFFLDEEAPARSALAEELLRLQKAEDAIREQRYVLAEELLRQVEGTAPAILRQKLLHQARLPGAKLSEIAESLPSLDEELLLRAEAALAAGKTDRCAGLLAAAEDPASETWNLLAGRLHLARREYAEAAACFHRAEDRLSNLTAPYLEQCYRELGDFKQAYEYACKQR